MKRFNVYLSREEILELLKDCGITFKNSSISINKNLLPALSYTESGNFKLYYPAPNNIGQQEFEFEPNFFLNCYNASKYPHFTSKAEYTSFDKLFFEGRKTNNRVKTIFALFSVNPTVLRQVAHQDKKKARRTKIEPKISNVKDIFGIQDKSNKGKKKVNIEDNQLALRNMDLAVQKAAKYFDFRYFRFYVDAYKDLHCVSMISKRKEDLLFQEFKNKVDNLQK